MSALDRRTELVFDLFRGTGGTYDEIVERTTLRLDSRWKRAILERMRSPRRVLDLASGTGMVSFLVARRWADCRLLGVELQPEYHRIAEERAAENGLADRIRFVCARAEDVPLEAGAFDHAVTSYLPKYADLDRLVPRLREALAPGGRLVFHDFVYPDDPRVLTVWRAQFRDCLAAALEQSPEWATIFRELPELIRATTWVDDLVHALEASRFRDIAVERLSMGCAAIVTARR